MFDKLMKITGIDFKKLGFNKFDISGESRNILQFHKGEICLGLKKMASLESIRSAFCNNETLSHILDWGILKPLPKYQELYNVLFPDEIIYFYQDCAIIFARKGFPSSSERDWTMNVIYTEYDTFTNKYSMSNVSSVGSSIRSLLDVKSGYRIVEKLEMEFTDSATDEFHIRDGKIIIPNTMSGLVAKSAIIRETKVIQDTDSIIEAIIYEIFQGKKQSKRHIVSLRNGILTYSISDIPEPEWMSYFNSNLDYVCNPTNRKVWHMLDEYCQPKYVGRRLFVDSSDIYWVKYSEVWLPLYERWLDMPDKDIQNEILIYKSIG